MTITARYPGICDKCGKAIKAGDKIDWQGRGSRAWHATCAAAPLHRHGTISKTTEK